MKSLFAVSALIAAGALLTGCRSTPPPQEYRHGFCPPSEVIISGPARGPAVQSGSRSTPQGGANVRTYVPSKNRRKVQAPKQESEKLPPKQ